MLASQVTRTSFSKLTLTSRVFGVALALTLGATTAQAASTGNISCPLFHCAPEATGIMYQPIVTPTTAIVQSSLGQLKAQGCSGDGTKLACIFNTDNVPAGTIGSGVLKIIDPTSLNPIWGDAGVQGSYVLGDGVSIGEVPFLFANGTIGAGDASGYALYNSDGTLKKLIPLGGKGAVMGLTPISSNYAIITQSNGILTLIDTDKWVAITSLPLKDPNGATVTLASPSTGSSGVLYAPTKNFKGVGFLFAVDVETDANGSPVLKARAVFPFEGTTGASPVVVKPSISGLATNLLLMHVPGLTAGDTQNRLLGLLDNGTSFSILWSVPLNEGLGVAPTFDEVTHTVYYQYNGENSIYPIDMVKGTPTTEPYNMQLIGNFPSDFQLNGHIIADQITSSPSGLTGGFTLLLSGSAKATKGVTGGQFVMGFQPMTGKFWKVQTLAKPESNTDAWSLIPSGTAGYYCMSVVGPTSGISRICN